MALPFVVTGIAVVGGVTAWWNRKAIVKSTSELCDETPKNIRKATVPADDVDGKPCEVYLCSTETKSRKLRHSAIFVKKPNGDYLKMHFHSGCEGGDIQTVPDLGSYTKDKFIGSFSFSSITAGIKKMIQKCKKYNPIYNNCMDWTNDCLGCITGVTKQYVPKLSTSEMLKIGISKCCPTCNKSC